MKFSLSNYERSELLLQHKRERDSHVADRIKAVLLEDEGWREDEIARALFLSHEGVRQHINDYMETLASGSPSKIFKNTI